MTARKLTVSERRDRETDPDYRLWVNEPRTVFVRLWQNGKLEVATREFAHHTWGPPVYLDEEDVR